MSMFKVLIVIFLILLMIPKQLSLAENISTDSAQEVKYDKTNPGSPYYIFKRLKETVILNFLKFGEKNKAKYSEGLLETRLKELTYIVREGQMGILENVAHRYTNQAGVIIEKYLKLNQGFKPQAERHIPILGSLRDAYPSNTPQWLMIQESVDTAKRIAGS